MNTKTCTLCEKEKPIGEFGTHRGVPNDRSSCKQCEREYQRQYRQRNLERVRKISREYMAAVRSTPEGREKLLKTQRKTWNNGGNKRQRAYLDSLRETNFFKWKARKSYIWLNEHELRGLWDKQNGLCALTGRPLGSTAELDHIIPRTRGGKDTLENAQWLCSEANQAKRKMLDSEFIELCREVIAWIEKKPTPST